MKPDDAQQSPQGRGGTPNIPSRPFLSPPTRSTSAHQQAAVNLVRDQIDSIYNTDTSQHMQAAAPSQPVGAVSYTPEATQQVIPAVKQQSHDTSPQPQADQWNKYHTAWQEYYQKYYERYYIGQVHNAHKHLHAQATAVVEKVKAEADKKITEAGSMNDVVHDVSQDEALYDLRQSLLGKVHDSARKVRKSRHFVPITSAVVVMLLFLFMQYNRILIANVMAYVSPGNIDPQNIVVDPTLDENVSSDPKLIIPKINVDVPVAWGVGTDNASQLKAMESGVAQFGIPGANSVPGQIGNTVIAGHSSNDIIDGGDYKFIFAQLDKLQNGDTIYINYQSKRYSYTITKKEVVMPTEVNKLIYATDKPVLTLITCTPLGTAEKRLLVTAEQVSPDPSKALPAPVGSGASVDGGSIPGNSPTILERVFSR